MLSLILSILYVFLQSQGVNYQTTSSYNYNKTQSQISLSNINQADVKNATGLLYAVILDNKPTTPSYLLKENGFESISASTFNYTSVIPQNATYPQTIVSIVYLTKNSTVANQIMEGAVFPFGKHLSTNLTNSTLPANTTKYQNLTLQYYDYAGHTVGLYESLDLSIFNASAVSYAAPAYQYTTAFTSNNIAGIVTTGGNMRMDPAISVNLAKALFRRLVQSNLIT